MSAAEILAVALMGGLIAKTKVLNALLQAAIKKAIWGLSNKHQSHIVSPIVFACILFTASTVKYVYSIDVANWANH